MRKSFVFWRHLQRPAVPCSEVMRLTAKLFQLGVLVLGRLQDGDVGVGILPQA
jgi:hypothetical protein